MTISTKILLSRFFSKRKRLKELSDLIDFYQLQIISIGRLPDGDAVIKKRITDNLQQKLSLLLNEYEVMLND